MCTADMGLELEDEPPPLEPPVPVLVPEGGAGGAEGVPEDIYIKGMVSVTEERSATVHAKTRSHDLSSPCNCNGQNAIASCPHVCNFYK